MTSLSHTESLRTGIVRRSFRTRLAFTVAGYGAVAVATCLLAPLVGSTPVSLTRAFDRSIPFVDNVDAQIFFIARMPRVLAGAITGATLAAAGVVMQALLRNPLATPFTLGVSAGAALGAILVITFGGGIALGAVSPVPLASLAAWATVAVLTALFIRQERRAPEPVLPLSLFAIRSFTVGSLTMGAMGFAMMSAMVFLPLYFQLVLQLAPAEAGFMMLPQIVTMLLSSILGGRVSARLGRPKLFMASGIALEASGLAGLAWLAHVGAPIPAFLGALAVLGLGMGIAMPHATVIVQNAVPAERLGVATASMSFIRSLGGAMGVAVSGGLMGARLSSGLAAQPGVDAQALIAGGMDAIQALSPAVLPAVHQAFSDAITVSFEVGGAVMALAWVVAMTLRGTEFAAAPAAR